MRSYECNGTVLAKLATLPVSFYQERKKNANVAGPVSSEKLQRRRLGKVHLLKRSMPFVVSSAKRVPQGHPAEE